MLTPAERKELKGRAHKLDPIVMIGAKGLTDEVVQEVELALKAHELIKVRAATDDRKMRETWMREICERLAADPVQQIGKVLVIYRENPREKPEPKLGPRPSRPSSRAGDDDRDVKRTERRRFRTASRPPESGPRRRRPRSSR